MYLMYWLLLHWINDINLLHAYCTFADKILTKQIRLLQRKQENVCQFRREANNSALEASELKRRLDEVQRERDRYKSR